MSLSVALVLVGIVTTSLALGFITVAAIIGWICLIDYAFRRKEAGFMNPKNWPALTQVIVVLMVFGVIALAVGIAVNVP